MCNFYVLKYLTEKVKTTTKKQNKDLESLCTLEGITTRWGKKLQQPQC